MIISAPGLRVELIGTIYLWCCHREYSTSFQCRISQAPAFIALQCLVDRSLGQAILILLSRLWFSFDGCLQEPRFASPFESAWPFDAPRGIFICIEHYEYNKCLSSAHRLYYTILITCLGTTACPCGLALAAGGAKSRHHQSTEVWAIDRSLNKEKSRIEASALAV